MLLLLLLRATTLFLLIILLYLRRTQQLQICCLRSWLLHLLLLLFPCCWYDRTFDKMRWLLLCWRSLLQGFVDIGLSVLLSLLFEIFSLVSVLILLVAPIIINLTLILTILLRGQNFVHIAVQRRELLVKRDRYIPILRFWGSNTSSFLLHQVGHSHIIRVKSPLSRSYIYLRRQWWCMVLSWFFIAWLGFSNGGMRDQFVVICDNEIWILIFTACVLWAITDPNSAFFPCFDEILEELNRVLLLGLGFLCWLVGLLLEYFFI